MAKLVDSPLAKTTKHLTTYSPQVLFPVDRQLNRNEIGISQPLPFFGFDIWQEYEISWLDLLGKPQVAIGQIIFPCTSPMLIESKSLKLYIQSLSNTAFPDHLALTKLIEKDLSQRSEAQVVVNISPLHLTSPLVLTSQLAGTCLDSLPISVNEYELNPTLLSTTPTLVQESVYSHLLKSICPVTGQPDWGSIHITYTGSQIDHANLLKYIISFRNYQEFAENCVERIFIDIQHHCQPSALTITGLYTRRGGKDINPVRSTNPNISPTIQRNIRQ